MPSPLQGRSQGIESVAEEMRMLFLLAATLLITACQSHYAQVSELRRPEGGARIMLMPPDVELYEIGTFGTTEPRAEWTETARTWLVAALREEQAERGLSLVDYDAARVSEDDRDAVEQLQNLHGVVGRTILDHHYVPVRSLPSRDGKVDWSLGPEARRLEKAADVQYALFIYIRDTYSSVGHRVMQVAMLGLFFAPSPGGMQLGFASLVDLETGDIVWFNRILRDFGDLRSEASAQTTARELLTGLPK
jgi:hypothetical protein